MQAFEAAHRILKDSEFVDIDLISERNWFLAFWWFVFALLPFLLVLYCDGLPLTRILHTYIYIQSVYYSNGVDLDGVFVRVAEMFFRFGVVSLIEWEKERAEVAEHSPAVDKVILSGEVSFC